MMIYLRLGGERRIGLVSFFNFSGLFQTSRPCSCLCHLWRFRQLSRFGLRFFRRGDGRSNLDRFLPRSWKMFSFRRSCLRASSVALTTLAGLPEPSDLARRSLMPAASTTARTPPPAMRPVPGEAGRSNTRPPPNWPMTSWGMVLPRSETGSRCLRAASVALRIASVTSLALPKTDADFALAVPDDEERAKAEAATALQRLWRIG